MGLFPILRNLQRSCAALLLLHTVFAPGGAAAAQQLGASLGPGLSELHRIYMSSGAAQALSHARQRRIPLDGDRVTVVLELEPGRSVDESALVSQGVHLRSRYRQLLQVTVPMDRVPSFASNVAGLRRIRLPHRPRELIESEGVTISGAAAMQALGSNGQGVRVAVIDLGFQTLTSAIAAGELPATVVRVDCTGSNCTGTEIESTTKHGTGVAEVVHDMAPEAELYLLKVGSEVDLGNAKDYCISNGIEVINHSVAWLNVAFYDGTGIICDIANDAHGQEILWVNAAGNYAGTHYQAMMTDTDSDTRHEFATGDEALSFSATAGKTVEILMNWDAYPVTNHDYNLFLYNVDPDLNPGAAWVESSQDNQGNGPFRAPPAEYLAYTIPTTGTYYLVIRKKDNRDANLPFDVYFLNVSALEHRNTVSSLAQPADATGVLAVGAVNLSDALRGYSSRGPTNDGRTKPDVSATDGVSNLSYTTFSGTSAAAPHVAGAAALILSQDPSLTVQQLWSRLEMETKDLGVAGKDSSFGAGRTSLDADQDGLTHDDEAVYGTDPTLSDTDGDGLSDGDEVAVHGTNPALSDTDGEGLNDGDEINLYGTDPLLVDTDGDAFTDAEEILGSSDPLDDQSTPEAYKGDIAPHGIPDGEVTVADAMLALRMAAGLVSPTPTDVARGDVAPQGNPDGTIDIADALLIMRRAAGLPVN